MTPSNQDFGQIVKTVVSWMLGFAVVAILVFGPRGDTKVAQGVTVVHYWEKWTGDEQAEMGQIVTDYNNTVGKEKHIHVEYLSMSGIDQKTLAATTAGNPPDVAGIWDNQIAQFAAIDALEPLDDLAASYHIDEKYYLPIYWEGCHYHGKLWGLVSTPATVALHYNKKLFQDAAPELRAAGLDPNRAPRTLDELDAYAKAIDKRDSRGKLVRAGFIPLEPGWWLGDYPDWFGARVFDDKTQKFTLTDPGVIKCFKWIQSYSKRMGKDALADFRSGFGGFSSPSNAFMSEQVAMEQQGPWMVNYIRINKPEMNNVLKYTPEQLKTMTLEERQKTFEYGVAPFPSAVPGLNDVSRAAFDVLCIPRGAKHVKEAFDFIAFVNSQKEMEKLCSLHCKNSPLAVTSADFINHHPNPYIKVFEELAKSANCHNVPAVATWPQVNDDLSNIATEVALLQGEPEDLLKDAQARAQANYDQFMAHQRARGKAF